MVARFHELYAGMRRYGGFTAKLCNEEALRAFPRSVVPEARRRREYWSSVLSRAEVDSSYRPARRLWRQERVGHYVPSHVAVRTATESGVERYVRLSELLCLAWLEPDAAGAAQWTAPPPSP